MGSLREATPADLERMANLVARRGREVRELVGVRHRRFLPDVLDRPMLSGEPVEFDDLLEVMRGGDSLLAGLEASEMLLWPFRPAALNDLGEVVDAFDDVPHYLAFVGGLTVAAATPVGRLYIERFDYKPVPLTGDELMFDYLLMPRRHVEELLTTRPWVPQPSTHTTTRRVRRFMPEPVEISSSNPWRVAPGPELVTRPRFLDIEPGRF